MNTLFSFLVNEDNGLTTAGYVVSAIIIFLLIILASLLAGNKRKIGVKELTFSALALALAYVTSTFEMIKMPMGVAVTPFSMLFVTLIGYWYGPATGLTAAIAYGFLQLIQGPYIVTLPQVLMDYVFAFGALGLSGFFHKAKNGLVIGYVVGIIGRFVFSFLSGVIFFGEYAPEGWSPEAYSAAYNGAYIFLEGAITIVLLLIPAVKFAMERVKQMAVS